MVWFNDWKVGSTNNNGLITKIFHKNNDFIIYEVDNSGWFLFDSIDDIGKNFSSIQTEWTETTNLLNTPKERSRYIGKVAGALKECLLGDINASKNKLKKVKESIADYKTTIGRIEYLFGSVIAAFILIVCLILSSYFIEPTQILILKIIFFGIIGGILSVSFNINSVNININSGDRKVYMISGTTRVCISAISSLIVYVLIKGKFFLGLVSEADNYVFFSLAVLSGFSEVFIPNLLEQVKDQSLQKKEEEKS